MSKILIEKSTVKKALDALENNTGEYRVEGAKNILQSALAQPAKPLTYDQVFDAVRPLYADDRTCYAAIEVSIDEYRAIEAAHNIKE